MAKLDYGPAIELLKGAHTVAICGHVNPDGDALGSVLALTCALRSAGYQVTPLLATRERPHLYDFLYAYEDLTPACEYGAVPDVFISVASSARATACTCSTARARPSPSTTTKVPRTLPA